MANIRSSFLVLFFIFMASPIWAVPLTLQECLENAQKNNPALQSSLWDTRMSQNGIRLANSTNYPRVDLRTGYTLQQAPQAVIINGKTAETQEPNFASGSLTANYTIYDFGRREAKLQQANAHNDLTLSLFDAKRADVSMQVIETYFGILEADRLVVAAAESVTQVEQHKVVAQVLFEQGVVTRNDLLQAEVKLAVAKQNLLAFKNRRENIWLQLNYLIGADQFSRRELDEKSGMAAIGDVSPNDVREISRRSEIKAFRSALAMSEAELQESRSSFYPEIYSQLSLDYVQNKRVNEQAIMSAAIGLKMNLFEGFAATANRERAIISQFKNKDLLRQTEAQIKLEIATSRNDMQVARERIAETEAAIRQSEENLRINNERYQERVGTATEVLDAQTLLTQTKSDYYRALFDFQVASARLKHAKGDL